MPGRDQRPQYLETDLSAVLDRMVPLAERLWRELSCSLQHVPVTLNCEQSPDADIKSWPACALQKLDELRGLDKALRHGRTASTPNGTTTPPLWPLAATRPASTTRWCRLPSSRSAQGWASAAATTACALQARQLKALVLDVLAERNDMVEYFDEQLDGYAFSQFGRVQSYGSRCLKPPILFGDIPHTRAMTTEWILSDQSLTCKPVKGMLTHHPELVIRA